MNIVALEKMLRICDYVAGNRRQRIIPHNSAKYLILLVFDLGKQIIVVGVLVRYRILTLNLLMINTNFIDERHKFIQINIQFRVLLQ